MSSPRYSFRDPITQILKCYGYVATNQPGDIRQVEPEDFNLDLRTKTWRWNGTQWVEFVPPAVLSNLAKALDLATASTPTVAQIKTVLQEWRKQVS